LIAEYKSSVKGATARIIISIPEDLQTLCSGLEHFKLGAALGHFGEDTLIISNALFRERLGLTDDFSTTVRLRDLLYFDRGYSGIAVENNDAQRFTGFSPCALKSFAGNEIIPGRALSRADGMILLLLVPLPGDAMFEGFIHERSVGRSEERSRTSKFFHDLLSSKMMVASHFARAADEKFSAAADGRIELGKVMSVLDEAIDAIVQGFDTTDFP
jgi:hypothetical protein